MSMLRMMLKVVEGVVVRDLGGVLMRVGGKMRVFGISGGFGRGERREKDSGAVSRPFIFQPSATQSWTASARPTFRFPLFKSNDILAARLADRSACTCIAHRDKASSYGIFRVLASQE